jgi:phage gp46-like protein
MAFDRFEGDPRIVLGADGSTLSIKGGQPVMDQGLENVPLIDLFTQVGWWGNDLFEEKSQRIGSNFENVARSAATVTGINNVESAGKAALKHMIDEKLASATLVKARNPSGNRVEVAVLIQPPGKDLFTLLATKHGSNWVAQKQNPAYERV